MAKNNILLTNITIAGNFHDISVYSGLLYIWKDTCNVSIYHWHKWVENLHLKDLPIYQIPVLNQSLFVSEDDLEPYLYKKLYFIKPVRSHFLFRHRLYYIDETGFYVRAPEKANTEPMLLAKGPFNHLEISHTNRIILSSKTDGVFEWHKNTIIPWDSLPTSDIIVQDNNVLQLSEDGDPIQMLIFEIENKEPYLVEKKSKNNLPINTIYYETSLDLGNTENAKQSISLFRFLPSENTISDQIIDGPISIVTRPHPSLSGKTLDDQVLSLSENRSELLLHSGNDIYLSIDNYQHYRIYSKSHAYQNHLHLVSDKQISIFMFYKLL